MRFLLIFVAILAALVALSCGASRKKRQSYWRRKNCQKECEGRPYQPTCAHGTGLTYQTSCECFCHGNYACSQGACTPYRRRSYRNHHVSPGCRGECAAYGYNPICGEDWLEYDNACQLQCMGVDPLPGNVACNNYG